MLRPEPRPPPSSSSAITTHGRRQRSTSREATIPTTPGCQPSPATTIAPWLACGAQAASAANRMRVSACWRSRVEQVELARDLGGAVAVLGQQQLERGVGAAHAAGRVDARAEPEAERRARSARPARRRPRAISARRPGLSRARQRDQALADDAAVLAAQRHEVADGGERGQVEVLLGGRRGSQRLAELEHHAGGAQLGAAVAARAPGCTTTQSGSSSPGRWWSVTTTSSPAARGGGDLLDGGDAAVDGDQQAHAALGQPLDRGGREAVALVEAAGQLPDRVARRGRAACARGSPWSRRRPRRSRRRPRSASRARRWARISSQAAGDAGQRRAGRGARRRPRNARASSTVAKPRRARIAPTGARHAQPGGKPLGERHVIGLARPSGRPREHPTHPARGRGRNAELAARRRAALVRAGARVAVVDAVLAVDAGAVPVRERQADRRAGDRDQRLDDVGVALARERCRR